MSAEEETKCFIDSNKNELESGATMEDLHNGEENIMEKCGKMENNEAVDEDVDMDTQSNVSFRGRPSSCVFVASLAASLSDDELCVSVTDNFKKYGNLARVKVLRDPANRPYAFVQYTNEKDARKALKRAQGSVLNGRILRCEPAKVNRTLFVTHNKSISFVDVQTMCESFGELEQVVPNRENNQYLKRYSYPISNGNSWFVQFAYRDDAIRAFANLRSDPYWDVEWVQNVNVPKHFNLLLENKKMMKRKNKATATVTTTTDSDSNTINIDQDDSNGNNFIEKEDTEDNIIQYNSGSEDETNTDIDSADDDNSNLNSDIEDEDDDQLITIDKKSIFVGQLDPNTTKETLTVRFSKHGKITDINLIIKPTNIFAFIQYETEEAAAAALERENHAIFLNKTMHVQYKEIGGLHGRRNFRRPNTYFNDHHSKPFTGPQFNFAPPPINMYRRRASMENDSMFTYMPPPQMPGLSEYEMNNYLPYMKNSYPYKRKSLPNSWSSARNFSNKTDSDNNQNTNDVTSEVSESVGQAGSTTTYDNSSAGSMSNNNNNNTNTTSTTNNSKNSNNNNNNNNRKKYYKRNSISYNESVKPYYFQPYYYHHPMHYPMGPMNPSVSSQGSAGNQPYMMVYPMPPPPPSGSMMNPPMPMGQIGNNIHNSPTISENQYNQLESESFVPERKTYRLDY